MALFLRKKDGVVFLRLSNGIHGPVLRTASSGAPALVAAAFEAYTGAALKTDSVSKKAQQWLKVVMANKTEAEAQHAAEKVPDRTCVPVNAVFHLPCAACADWTTMQRTLAYVFFFFVIARRHGMQARVIEMVQSPAAVEAAMRAKDACLAQLTQKIAGADARISKFDEHSNDRVNEV
jgi:hypothetical protein